MPGLQRHIFGNENRFPGVDWDYYQLLLDLMVEQLHL